MKPEQDAVCLCVNQKVYVCIRGVSRIFRNPGGDSRSGQVVVAGQQTEPENTRSGEGGGVGQPDSGLD